MTEEHLRRMARYDARANRRPYPACAQLLDDAYHEPRRALVGSIHGTVAPPLDLICCLRTAGDPS